MIILIFEKTNIIFILLNSKFNVKMVENKNSIVEMK
jgi:hypothetical protein